MTLTKSEISLYDRCEKGDQLAQMQVYDRYSKAMFNVAVRILKDDASAEDAMQESMITAFTKMNQWNREATFGAWLKRIVINNSLTKLRQLKKIEVVSYDVQELQLEEVTDEPLDLEATGMSAQQVMSYFKQLKDSYREILTLFFMEGMDHEEISEITGMSYGMCRTTLSRAKDSLRKKIQANGSR